MSAPISKTPWTNEADRLETIIDYAQDVLTTINSRAERVEALLVLIKSAIASIDHGQPQDAKHILMAALTD